ncbi:MAG: hypothetical protein EBX50_20540, partial [Chitinophagia bacterium]|nr:hypothetical protein [Chitinophagia bacterium]
MWIAIYTSLLLACNSGSDTTGNGSNPTISTDKSKGPLSETEKESYRKELEPMYKSMLIKTGFSGGILVAKREWDKGENVTAAFSLLTALLPILKYSKNVSIIRGVSSDELSRLSEIMTESKLNTKSTKTEFEAFMNGLNDNDKKLLLKVLDYDEVSA